MTIYVLAKFKCSFLHVRAKEGADVVSGHHLLMEKIRFKLKNYEGQKKASYKYNIVMVRDDIDEPKNRFKLTIM